jgi:adenosylcobinamide-phosphate guanylyltransferase
MSVTALIMAGGKGARMVIQEEKPMLKVGGKTIIEHVLTALKNAEKVKSVVVAVSDYTPKTAKLMAMFPVKVIKTPGKEYVFDMGYAVRKLKLQTVLAIAADLPLITGETIDNIVERYEQCGMPALTVVVPMETKKRLGLYREYAFEVENRLVIPAGINVIDGRKIGEKELGEEICVIDSEEVAVNVNTVKELRIAESLFTKRLLKNA